MDRAADRLDGFADTAGQARAASLTTHAGPLDLACALNPRLVRTPALELLSAELERAVAHPGVRLVVSFSPQEGKGLALDTPIATPDGWATMGELRVDDVVFGGDGHPCRVVLTSDVRHLDCYRLTFQDGSQLIADGDHRWRVWDRQGYDPIAYAEGRRSHRCWKVVDTRELARRPRRYSVPTQPVMMLPDRRDLAVPPYVLGAWLGDGHSASATFTCADQPIIDELAAEGEPVRRVANCGPYAYTWARPNSEAGKSDPGRMQARLRALGVLGDKHIPTAYLRASEKQRLSLLQGLMDTDGSAYRNGSAYSACEFTTTNPRLADDVLTLVRSLGIRCYRLQQRSTLAGRDCGPVWKIKFTTDVPVFRLPRKAARLYDVPGPRKNRPTIGFKSIEPVPSVPTRCIQVDSPQATFLAGSDLVVTHNSSLARAAVLRKLQHAPDHRVLLASYGEDLARASSLAIRQLIEGHGTDAVDEVTGLPTVDRLGLAIAPDQGAAGGWRLRGHEGGVIARGIRSGATGRPVDFLVVDDPIKDQQDADSETIRKRLHDWWTSVSETRLPPWASVVVIATRWHELDLSGWLLTHDELGEWRSINIPALSDGKTPDALGRPPGVWMVSARGRTPQHWAAIRKRVGERTFAALYQGRPAPVEGGIFKREWFDTWRVDQAPPGCLPPVVVVDPADNEGDGDEAGILLACQHPATRRVIVLDDLSAAMSVARWARVALLTCVRRDAPTLAYEQSLSQVPKRVRAAWEDLYRQATALREHANDHAAACTALARPGDPPEAADMVAGEVAELDTDDVAAILRIGQVGPQLRKITARGNKQARMVWAAPRFETGRAILAGRFPKLEHQAATWSPGQDSPDRVDALVHASALVDGQLGEVVTSPPAAGRIPTTSVSLRNRAGSRINRSTRR